MIIPTSANAMNKQIAFVCLMDKKVTEFEPKVKKDKDGTVTGLKVDAAGRKLYSMSNLEVIELNADGTKRKGRNTYLSVAEPCDLNALTYYALDGNVYVECYSTRDGLLTVITADRVIPAKQNN